MNTRKNSSNNDEIYYTQKVLWSLNNIMSEPTSKYLEKIARKNDDIDQIAKDIKDMLNFQGELKENVDKMTTLNVYYLGLILSDPNTQFYNENYMTYIVNFLNITFDTYKLIKKYFYEIYEEYERHDLVKIYGKQNLLEYLQIQLLKVEQLQTVKVTGKDLQKECYNLLEILDEEEKEDNDISKALERLQNINQEIQQAMNDRNINRIRNLNQEKKQLQKEQEEELKKDREKREKLSYLNIDNYVGKNNKNFIFVVLSRTISDSDIICFDYISLRNILIRYREWLLECQGEISESGNKRISDIDKKNFYVGIPINKDGFLGFVNARQLKTVLEIINSGDKKTRIFYITPVLDSDGTHKLITHTVSYQNSRLDIMMPPNYVSANHCQSGSAISIFDIKVCDDKDCLK